MYKLSYGLINLQNLFGPVNQSTIDEEIDSEAEKQEKGYFCTIPPPSHNTISYHTQTTHIHIIIHTHYIMLVLQLFCLGINLFSRSLRDGQQIMTKCSDLIANF